MRRRGLLQIEYFSRIFNKVKCSENVVIK